MTHIAQPTFSDNGWTIHALALGAFLLSSVPALQSIAQTRDDSVATEQIIGTEVETGQIENGKSDEVIAALEHVAETTRQVRMTYKIDGFEIVFLGDDEPLLGSERLSQSIAEHENAIGDLRREMGLSTIYFLALEDKAVAVDRVVAAEITEDDKVTVFVTGAEK